LQLFLEAAIATQAQEFPPAPQLSHARPANNVFTVVFINGHSNFTMTSKGYKGALLVGSTPSFSGSYVSRHQRSSKQIPPQNGTKNNYRK